MMKQIGTLLIAGLAAVSANSTVTVSSTATLGSSSVFTTSGTSNSGDVLFNFDTSGLLSGLLSGFTFSGSGSSLVNGVLNIQALSGVATPTADATTFLSVGSGGYEKIVNSVTSYDTLSLYWGSPDTANTLDLLDATGSSIYQVTSATVTGLTSMSSGLVVLTSSQSFYGVKFGSSSSVNFELDNIRFSNANVSPVPEPASWAMMLIGFGAVGYRMRRNAARFALGGMARP